MLALLSSAFLVPCALAALPINGPLLPRPTSLSSSTTFIDAINNLTEILDQATENDAADIFANNVSFSISITSFSAAANNPVLWDYHHLASERSPLSTSASDGNSQYMVASVTKVFTDLLVLRTEIDINAPVTRFIPELGNGNNSESTVVWEDITILDLMSHLSGIPQNYGFPEIWSSVPQFEALGFPTLAESDFAACGIIGLNADCNTSSLLKGLATAKSSLPSGFSAAYSNLAFALLGIVLERETNSPFSNLLATEISEPLGMNNTGVSPSNATNAVVPTGLSVWGQDLGIMSPAGAMYSSTNDLSKFLHAILTSSPTILNSPAKINKWLKPLSALSSSTNLIGAPWEIFRTAPGQLTPAHPHGIDLYIKDGGLWGYYSRIVLIPEYGIGITCLTAGPKIQPLNTIMEAILAVLTPAIEKVAREQANQTYIGTYISKLSPKTINPTVDANITFSMDGGPGLILTELYRNGSSILDAFSRIYAGVDSTSTSTDTHFAPVFRLYPANITTESTISFPPASSTTTTTTTITKNVVLEDWRLSYEIASSLSTNTTDSDSTGSSTGLSSISRGVFRDMPTEWNGLDSVYYGGRAVDRFVMVKDGDSTTGSTGDNGDNGDNGDGGDESTGRILGVMIPALRLELWRDG